MEKETRAANDDGTSRFMRPLPGSARLYPETDVLPMPLSKDFLEKLKKELPEPWAKKFEKFKSKYRLSEDLARQMMQSENFNFFERIVTQTNADTTIVANTFTSTLKDLERREKIELSRISEKHYFDIFEALEKGKILKEALPELFKYFAEKPGEIVASAIEELSLSPISASDLNKMIKELLEQSKNLTYEKAVGLIMSKVRGRIDAQVVMDTVKKYFK
jgi:glutamyl-tRNA(Gln) amidotransferase subunit E